MGKLNRQSLDQISKFAHVAGLAILLQNDRCVLTETTIILFDVGYHFQNQQWNIQFAFVP